MKTMRWAVTLLVGVGMTLIGALSGHSRDNNNRYLRTSTCADANTKDGQRSSTDCLEGHECVICKNDDMTGQVTTTGGTGVKLWRPRLDACAQTDRLIGICTGSGGISNCDVSTFYVDGTCGGSVTTYKTQNH